MSGQTKLSFLHCIISQIIMQSTNIYWAPIMCQALGAEKTLVKSEIPALPSENPLSRWGLSTKVNKQTWFQILLRTVKISTGDIVGKDWKWGTQQAEGTLGPHTSQVKVWHVRRTSQEPPWLELRTCMWWGVILETAGRGKVWLLCNRKQFEVC